MSDDSPGLSAVQFMPEPNSKDVNLCIICQHKTGSQGNTKLTSTEEGRKVLIQTSQLLQDEIIKNLPESDLNSIKYHVKPCFSNYKKKGERYNQTRKQKAESSTLSPLSSPTNHPKRSKVANPPTDLKDKPCVICDHMKCQGESKRYRIGDASRAKKLLKAAAFNKDSVQTRIIFMKTVGDVFAADIMYHNNCLIKYFMQFQRDVDALMEINFDDPDQIPLVESTFRSFINEIDITKRGYALSDVRDALIKELEPQGISGT